MERLCAIAGEITSAIRSGGISLARGVAIGIVVVFALFALLATLQFGFVFAMYRMIDDWAAVRLGFDFYLSNLVATVFTAVFSILTPTLFWYSLLGKKKAAGIAAVLGIQVFIYVSVYTVGSGVCFDRRTGRPLCWFTDTPRGRVWSYTPGFDPESGSEFRPYTREIKESEDNSKAKRLRR